MTEKEALIHLGIFEKYEVDAVNDAFEMKVFDIKDFMLKNPPISQLWISKLQKLQLLFEAQQTLVEQPSSVKSLLNFEYCIPKETHPLDWLQAYQHERSKCFLHLQGVHSIESITTVVHAILKLEEQLKKNYLFWFQDWFNSEEKVEVLSKDKLDIGVLTWNLRLLIEEGTILFMEGKFEALKHEVTFHEQLKKEFFRLNKLKF